MRVPVVPSADDVGVSIRTATLNERPLIEAMMAPYLADLGGSGPYPHLDRYWQEAGRMPYLILRAGRPIGFALVQATDHGMHELVEFYVEASSRGHGFGRRAALAVFGAHPGPWRVGVRKDNATGLRFWNAMLGDMPSVVILEIATPPALIYEFITSLA